LQNYNVVKRGSKAVIEATCTLSREDATKSEKRSQTINCKSGVKSK